MLNTNFIKNQLLPSQYAQQNLAAQYYLFNNNEYIPLTITNSSGLYIKDASDNYKLISPIKPGYNAQWFSADMEFLNNKLTQATKRVNALDFYRITNVVNDSSNFATAVTALTPNTGLIINTPTFTAPDNITYSRGDVVFKYNDLSVTKISAERGGIFYPAKLTKDSNNNNYIFQYNFTSAQPSIETTKTVLPNSNVWDATDAANYKKIEFRNLTSITPTILYNEVWTHPENVNELHFAAQRVSNKLVQPNIKMFVKTSNFMEDVYCDYTLSYDPNNSEWIIEDIPVIVTNVLVK